MSNRDRNVREIDAKEFLQMLAGAKPFGLGAGQAKRPIEQDIAKLKATADRYSAPLPFAVGDLVTPRADSILANAGRPHVVLEINDVAVRDLTICEPKEVNDPRFGARLDVRVASVCDCPHGEVTAHWEESWMLEPWTPPAEASEPAPKSAAPESAPAARQREDA